MELNITHSFYDRRKVKVKLTDRDILRTDITLAIVIVECLKKFKTAATNWPQEVESLDKWREIIDRIIWSFEQHQKDDRHLDFIVNSTDYKRYEDGLALFAKYFGDFWT